ncbi:AMP-dependent synthetase [Halobacteriales archaeon QS_3_64_16]|nr:MAG: AMP-dependent synthetase [Halobacteriales archaeon QS_3_64_16]
MNVANHIDLAARDVSEETAIVDPQRSLTYEDLAEETDAVANALAELGIEAGDRIALYLPNSVAFVTTYFGAVKRGAIPVPINMRLQQEGIEYVLGGAGARAIVTTGQFKDHFANTTVDGLEHLVVVDGNEGHQYSSLVEAADTEYRVYPRKGDELLGLMYTSGTTGRPKGVKRTHRNMGTNSHAMNLCMGWSRHDIGLTVNPCFHVSGLNVTLAPLLLARAENYFMPAWDPEDALAVIEKRAVTTTFCIMTIAIDLLNCESAGDYDTSSLRTFGAGGSPMPSDRIEAFERKFDCVLLEGYGMTETTANGAINRFDQDGRKPGSVGPPAKGVIDLRIEEPETGARVDEGGRSELLWRGDVVTTGYYNMARKESGGVRRAGGRAVAALGGYRALGRGRTLVRRGPGRRRDHLERGERLPEWRRGRTLRDRRYTGGRSARNPARPPRRDGNGGRCPFGREYYRGVDRAGLSGPPRRVRTLAADRVHRGDAEDLDAEDQ